MPDPADLPPDVRQAVRDLRAAGTLASYKQARARLATALEEHPEHAYVLESADAEFERRLNAIDNWGHAED